MQDEEIRIACINAVVAWTGSSNKLEDAKKFYEWAIAHRIPAGGIIAVPADPTSSRKGKQK